MVRNLNSVEISDFWTKTEIFTEIWAEISVKNPVMAGCQRLRSEHIMFVIRYDPYPDKKPTLPTDRQTDRQKSLVGTF